MKKTVFIIFTISCFMIGRGQDTGSMHFTFNHLAISVKDADRSAEFYSKILNCKEIENRAKLEGIRWFSIGDGKELHLISIIKEPILINKAIHIAFSTSNFDYIIKTLDEMKIIYSDWPGNLNKINIRADGIKQVFFQDPDGYWIEVNSIKQ